MSYAVQSDIVDRFGEELLYQIADRDRDQQLETAAIELALADASAEVDTYLSQRYTVPLDPTPRVVVRLAVDIAVYRLAQKAQAYTEEIRQRYEDAIELLVRMAKGTAGLGEAAEETGAGGEIKGGQILPTDNPERVFSRKTMKGLP